MINIFLLSLFTLINIATGIFIYWLLETDAWGFMFIFSSILVMFNGYCLELGDKDDIHGTARF